MNTSKKTAFGILGVAATAALVAGASVPAMADDHTSSADTTTTKVRILESLGLSNESPVVIAPQVGTGDVLSGGVANGNEFGNGNVVGSGNDTAIGSGNDTAIDGIDSTVSDVVDGSVSDLVDGTVGDITGDLDLGGITGDVSDLVGDLDLGLDTMFD